MRCIHCGAPICYAATLRLCRLLRERASVLLPPRLLGLLLLLLRAFLRGSAAVAAPTPAAAAAAAAALRADFKDLRLPWS